MKSLHRALAAALLVTSLTACGSSEATTGAEKLELRYQGSVGSVILPELAEELGYLAPLKLTWIGNTISGPQDIQAVATGQTDFGGAFNGAIAKLVAAKAPIKAVISYYGSDKDSFQGFYVLEDSPIKSARDLIGRKVAMNTLGAHAEAVLKEYLKRGGLTPEEIGQVEPVVVPPVSAEQGLRQRQIDVAVLGGVLRDKALERGGLRPLFSDFELFGPFSAGSYVLTQRFIDEHPATVKKFVEATAKAVQWTRERPREEVVAKFKEIIAKRGRHEDDQSVGFWKSTGIATAGGVIVEKEFQTWIDWLEREGELRPDQVKAAEVFTNAHNPYAIAAGGGAE
ncbi:ABC-type nitrate/sulfonate/bicarbonate transport system, substrate-binding protein [Sinosporangium album]|uniref:ABC-type nitrate/sulfonate/bicarbonate transport system, substrate-binding protein n=1 Tax=Sinosporangium album TaxID=504805 RepID=A0A1G8F1Z4_9ACTN|nr:ABC transporter substrate-binding protein [Sinosporangium album]SDH76104.1 ABC-type nitrate/sulfonate/bicarbonate transport system, substrate-binding protein [Sinosporangium album]